MSFVELKEEEKWKSQTGDCILQASLGDSQCMWHRKDPEKYYKKINLFIYRISKLI